MSRSPFEMSGSLFLGADTQSNASSVRKPQLQSSLNPTQMQQKLQKLTEDLQSQSGARADLQKKVWHLERLVKKRDQEKAQLKQTIKALQAAPPTYSMPEPVDRSKDRETEVHFRVAQAMTEHMIQYLLSNSSSIPEPRREEYKRQCTLIMSQNETPSSAVKHLDELLYHISLHASPGSVAPSSSSEEVSTLRRTVEEQKEQIGRLESRVRRYKTQVKDVRKTSSHCDNCLELEEELYGVQQEKSTLVSYIQTYRQQQEQLNDSIQKLSSNLQQKDGELARSKRALEKERHRRQEAEENMNGHKLSSQVDHLRIREDAQRTNQFLLEREEKIDHLTSQLSQKEEQLWHAESELKSIQLERDELLTSQQQQLKQEKSLQELLDRKREEVSELVNKLQESQHSLTDTQHRLHTWEDICNELQVSVGLLHRKVDQKLQILEDDVTSMGEHIRKTLGHDTQ